TISRLPSLCFFFFMLPPSLRSTLFPYTTLFRSDPKDSVRFESARHFTRGACARRKRQRLDPPSLISARQAQPIRLRSGQAHWRLQSRLRVNFGSSFVEFGRFLF